MDAQTAITIGLAVAVLLSFFASFMGAKTWRISQIVLVFFVFLASIGFWYLAGATLKAQKEYGEAALKLKQQIELEHQVTQGLTQGTDSLGDAANAVSTQLSTRENPIEGGVTAGLKMVETQLYNARVGRGRVWTGVAPTAPGADGEVGVKIEAPVPHALDAETIVFAFEEGAAAEGARYLGEFQVSASGEGTATLKPTMRLTQSQLDKLGGSEKTWILYEIMPTDSHEKLAKFEENDLRAMFPEASIQEYLKDGKDAEPDDPKERIVGLKANGNPATDQEADQIARKVYTRALRDYEQLFRAQNRELYLKDNQAEQKEHDLALVTAAVEKAQADVKFREGEVVKLTAELKKFEAERDVAKKHLDRVSGVLAKMDARAKALHQENLKLASELASRQLKAIEAIESQPASAEDSPPKVASGR